MVIAAPDRNVQRVFLKQEIPVYCAVTFRTGIIGTAHFENYTG